MRIDYSPKAVNDLQVLKNSIMEKFCDEDLVKDVISDIVENIRNLEIFPGMGKKLIISGNIEVGYRYLFCRKNYIFYRVENESVYIVRILHEKQDFIRILLGISEE